MLQIKKKTRCVRYSIKQWKLFYTVSHNGRMESFYQKKTNETRNKHRIFSQLSFSLPRFGLLVKAMPK